MIAARNHRNITIELKTRHRIIITDAVGHQHDALPGGDGEEGACRTGAQPSSASSASVGANTYLVLQNSQVTEMTPSWIM